MKTSQTRRSVTFLKKYIMNNIDYIYYIATSTDQFGTVVTQATYFIPFFDFLLVFLVLFLSIISVLTFDYFCYPRPRVIKIKNNLRISRQIKF